jgi:hypothetical protein
VCVLERLEIVEHLGRFRTNEYRCDNPEIAMWSLPPCYWDTPRSSNCISSSEVRNPFYTVRSRVRPPHNTTASVVLSLSHCYSSRALCYSTDYDCILSLRLHSTIVIAVTAGTNPER